jgi:DNA invertase Pin-like site-specific DNA recombinase
MNGNDPKLTVMHPGRGVVVGYIRVSTAEQNSTRQLEGLAIDKTFVDVASGKNDDRPQLKTMLAYVREGDVLLVHSMDRLARNVDDLRAIVRDLTARGVMVKFWKEGLTFEGDNSPIPNLMLSILGAIAEFERDLIRTRQLEGVAAAKARGVYKGRKPSITDAKAREIYRRMEAGESATALGKEYGVTRQTIYRTAAQQAALV